MAKENLTGLVVEGDTLQWSVLQRGRTGWQLADSGRATLPAVDTTAGAEDADAAEARLVAVLKEAAPRMQGRLTLAVPADQVLLRVLRLPSPDAAELGGMVSLQAEKLSPFPVDTMVVGHEVLQSGADASLVVAALVKTEVVDRLGRALRAAGLDAMRVDAAALGWWRVLRDAGRLPESGCSVEILLASPAPQLLVVRHGIPLVFRLLPVEPGKRAQPQELAREIGFTLMSLELEHGHLEPAAVTLWMDEEPDAFWREAVEAACGAPVTVAGASTLAPISEGVAWRSTGVNRVDLTPPSWTQTRESSASRRQLLVSAAVVVGVWLLVVGGAMGYLYIEQLRLERMRAAREGVRRPAMEVRDTRRRVSMVKRYLDHTHSALECLRILSELLPPDVDLTSFAFKKGEECRVSGEAAGVTSIYDFKGKLDAANLFPQTALQGPRTQQNGRESFDVLITLREGGEP